MDSLQNSHLSAASRDSFAVHVEGNDNKGVDNTNFIGQANADRPWRFIGTGRFALRTNTPSSTLSTAGNDDDEYMVLGYDSNLRSQDVIRVGKIIAEDISASAVTGDKIASNTTIVGDPTDIKAGLDGTGTATDEVRMFAGDTLANKASAPFRVTDAGALIATNATITGAVNASSGAFTGNVSTGAAFTAGNSGIDGTSGDSNTVRIFAGNALADKATAEFRVTDGGAVTATSGTIGSLTLASDKVTIGTSTTHGNADAKFYADNTGKFGLGDKLTFDGTNLTVSGAITATSGTFTGAVNATSLTIQQPTTPTVPSGMNVQMAKELLYLLKTKMLMERQMLVK